MIFLHSASAAEYFDSPSVYDDSGDGTAENPCPVVRAFAIATADNDVVTLKSGVYDINKSDLECMVRRRYFLV